MNITQEQVDSAILAVTSGPEWDIVVKALKNEVYHIQANAFNAKDWGDFMQAKGYVTGLAYVINLRETTLQTIAQEKANADL